jgi:hypothetical protein
VVGQGVETEEEGWRRHKTMECRVYEGATRAEADVFREKMRDEMGRNNCRRCWIS